MIQGMDEQELEDLLSRITSVNLSALCDVLELPRSGNKSEKIRRLMHSRYGEAVVSKLIRWVLFSEEEEAAYLATVDFYQSQLKEHHLPTSGSKDELIWRLIENQVFDPAAVLRSLQLDDLRSLYSEVFSEVPTLSAEKTIEAILREYGFHDDRRPSDGQSAEQEFGFVLMPFRKDMEGLYRDLIKPAVENTGYACFRADDLFTTNKIMDDIVDAIDRARFIIADLSGRNPNVFYEVGMSHEKNKKVILLAQSMDDVPVDLRPWRLLIYTDDEKGRKELVRRLTETIKTAT